MRQGGVMQVGSPAGIYERPADPFVGAFVATPPSCDLIVSLTCQLK
jgi:ABC-type proline/glycine betaine transport system ATPase subunit